ncbi:hypothetical protein P8C59_003616 [Phyllachora maydis]|uniref:Uncharacterized protein n=1 Tax=Phyllachora maydis TaxID=1825666 RepID=A0AAD9I0R2_9PEZI|nr:hypothetical protein P8C59_003616 [Phyllachora maydis]
MDMALYRPPLCSHIRVVRDELIYAKSHNGGFTTLEQAWGIGKSRQELPSAYLNSPVQISPRVGVASPDVHSDE